MYRSVMRFYGKAGQEMLKVDINLVFTIINLLVLFVAMRIFFFQPIKKIMDDRQAEADRQFDEVRAKQEEAEALKAQYEASLSEAEDKRKEMIAQARKDADVEYQKILKDAESTAREVKAAAVAEAENKKVQIIKSAEAEITSMVVAATAKAIGQAHGADTDNALYDQFINEAGDVE